MDVCKEVWVDSTVKWSTPTRLHLSRGWGAALVSLLKNSLEEELTFTHLHGKSREIFAETSSEDTGDVIG